MSERQKRLRHRVAFLLAVTTLMITVIVTSQGAASTVEVEPSTSPIQERSQMREDAVLHAVVKQLLSENVALRLENSAITQQLDDIQNPPTLQTFEPILYDIPLDEELQEYTQAICSSYEVEYELVLAMMWKESTFNVDSISKSGDYGLMQINKCNFKWLAEDLQFEDDSGDTFLNPYVNIQAGVYLMSIMLSKYSTERMALMAYNFGEGVAHRCWDAGIYTSKYAEAVLYRKELIYKNVYNITLS